MENLKGEIQIFDSKPSNSIVIDSTLVFDSTFSKKASLLVYAQVEEWQKFEIPETVREYDALEKFIGQTASQNNINTELSFPFLIEGRAKFIDWHVINWKDGDTIITYEKHRTSGLNGTLENPKLKLLGFYSKNHKGIFTHHSTNIHIHFKTTDKKVAGHLDNLVLGEGMILKLPKIL